MERADAMDSLLLQQHCSSGAGHFVGTSAVEDNLAVTGDLVVSVFNVLQREIKCTGYRFGIELDGERMPNIHHRDGITGIHAFLKFIHGDLRQSKISQNLLSMIKLVRDESSETNHDDYEQPASGLIKEPGELLKLIAEECTDSGADSCPDESPNRVKEEKRCGAHADDTCERGCNRAESRNEFGNDQCAGAMSIKEVLGAPHA